MEWLAVFVILLALAIIMISIAAISGEEGKKTEALKMPAWSSRYGERPPNIGKFYSYITKDGEFRLAGLLCDSGAPIVRSDYMRFCLPEFDTYIDLKVRYLRKKNKYIVRRIDYISGDVLEDGRLFSERAILWEDKDDANLVVHSAGILMPTDFYLSSEAAICLYDAIVMSRRRVEEQLLKDPKASGN